MLGPGDVRLGAISAMLSLQDTPASLPGATPVLCSRAVVPGSALDALLASAVNALDSLEYSEGLRASREARLLLPCVREVVPTESLYRLYFVEGLTAFYSGDEGAAKDAFRAAAAVDPTRPWNDDYAPEPQGTFLAALQEVLARSGAPLETGADLLALHIDGRAVSGTVAGLPAGTHFVQVGSPGSVRGAMVLVPESEEPVPLLGPQTLEAAIASGDPRVAPTLAAYAARNEWTETVLVISERGWVRFEPGSGRFEQRGGGPEPVTVAARPPLPAGIGLLASGGALGGIGFGLYAAKLAEGPDATRIEDYRQIYDAHLAGFGLGVAGVVTAGVGLVLTIAATTAPKASAAGPSRVLPFAMGGPSGASIGILGRF